MREACGGISADQRYAYNERHDVVNLEAWEFMNIIVTAHTPT